MTKRNGRLLAAKILWIGLVFGSCASGGGIFDRGPDLVPERFPGGQGRVGFCDRQQDGSLLVRVRNQGNEDALAQTTTIVVFSPGGPKPAVTPALPAGAPSQVSVEIPPECFSPDCNFTITVDAGNVVPELQHDAGDTSHEDNNDEAGRCIG